MLSAPPPMATSQSPSRIDCAAEMIACTPEPHRRLTVSAGVSTGMPALIMATREIYMSLGSVWITWPNTTWPISAGPTPLRASASAVTLVARSDGATSLSEPPNVPIAVRTPETRYTSRILILQNIHAATIAYCTAESSAGPSQRPCVQCTTNGLETVLRHGRGGIVQRCDQIELRHRLGQLRLDEIAAGAELALAEGAVARAVVENRHRLVEPQPSDHQMAEGGEEGRRIVEPRGRVERDQLPRHRVDAVPHMVEAVGLSGQHGNG